MFRLLKASASSLALIACSTATQLDKERVETEVVTPPPAPQNPSCGQLAYGLHHNPGDTLADIGRRRVGKTACAMPCDPPPSFATGPLGRNEHGGYAFLDLEAPACQLDGMSLPIASCHATCEKNDLLGRLSVELSTKDDEARIRLCRAFEGRMGAPTVGSCACPNDDIVWRPRHDEPGVILQFRGHYTLDCGFPDENYLPTHPPR